MISCKKYFFILPLFILMSTNHAMNQDNKDSTEEQSRKLAAMQFEEFFRKYQNPPQPRRPDIYDHFRGHYSNLPLLDPNGKVFCYMNLGDPYPADALDEQGNLKPGWQFRVPCTE